MSTYYHLQINVKDPVKLEKYNDAAPATVKSFGGELVFRSKVSKTISGKTDHSAAVVLKFSNKASANAWYESDEYQRLLKIRDEAAEVVVTCYDEADFY